MIGEYKIYFNLEVNSNKNEYKSVCSSDIDLYDLEIGKETTTNWVLEGGSKIKIQYTFKTSLNKNNNEVSKESNNNIKELDIYKKDFIVKFKEKSNIISSSTNSKMLSSFENELDKRLKNNINKANAQNNNSREDLTPSNDNIIVSNKDTSNNKCNNNSIIVKENIANESITSNTNVNISEAINNINKTNEIKSSTNSNTTGIFKVDVESNNAIKSQSLISSEDIDLAKHNFDAINENISITTKESNIIKNEFLNNLTIPNLKSEELSYSEQSLNNKSNTENISFPFSNAFYIAGLSENNIHYLPETQNTLGTCQHDFCSKLPSIQPDIIFKYPETQPSSFPNIEINEVLANIFFPNGLKICYSEEEVNESISKINENCSNNTENTENLSYSNTINQYSKRINPTITSSFSNQDGHKFTIISKIVFFKIPKQQYDSDYKINIKNEYIQLEKFMSLFEKAPLLQKIYERKLEEKLDIITEINFKDYFYLPFCFGFVTQFKSVNEFSFIIDQCVDYMVNEKFDDFFNSLKFFVFEMIEKQEIMCNESSYSNFNVGNNGIKKLSHKSVDFNAIKIIKDINTNKDDNNSAHSGAVVSFFLDNFAFPLKISITNSSVISSIGNNYLSICLLLRFNPEQIFTLIHAIKTEKKILFFSSFSDTIFPVINSFLDLIYPYEWSNTLIPLLSSDMLKYVQSFMPYIMGVNINLLYKVIDFLDESSEVIVVDIDSSIIFNSNYLLEFKEKLEKEGFLTVQYENSNDNFNNKEENDLDDDIEENSRIISNELADFISKLNDDNNKNGKSNITAKNIINLTTSSYLSAQQQIISKLQTSKEDILGIITQEETIQKLFNIISIEDIIKDKYLDLNYLTSLLLRSNKTNKNNYNINDFTLFEIISQSIDLKSALFNMDKELKVLFLIINKKEIDGFSKYVSYIDNVPLFNKEEFLKTKIDIDKAYFDEFVDTQLFQTFLQNKPSLFEVFDLKIKSSGVDLGNLYYSNANSINNANSSNRTSCFFDRNGSFANVRNSKKLFGSVMESSFYNTLNNKQLSSINNVNFINKDNIDCLKEICDIKNNPNLSFIEYASLIELYEECFYPKSIYKHLFIKPSHAERKGEERESKNSSSNINNITSNIINMFNKKSNNTIKTEYMSILKEHYNKYFNINNNIDIDISSKNNNYTQFLLTTPTDYYLIYNYKSLIDKSTYSIKILDNEKLSQYKFKKYYLPSNIKTQAKQKLTSIIKRVNMLTRIKTKLQVNSNSKIIVDINTENTSTSINSNNNFSHLLKPKSHINFNIPVINNTLNIKDLLSDYLTKILTNIKLSNQEKSEVDFILRYNEAKLIFPVLVFQNKFKEETPHCLNKYCYNDLLLLVSIYLSSCGASNKEYYEGVWLVTKSIFLYYKVVNHFNEYLYKQLVYKKDKVFNVWKQHEFWLFVVNKEISESKNINMNKYQDLLGFVILKLLPKVFDLKVDDEIIYDIIYEKIAVSMVKDVSIYNYH